MTFITALAISTGLFCGLWGLFTGLVPTFITFAGFAGTTSYFANSTEEGLSKVPKCFYANASGVIYATVSIYLLNKFHGGLWMNTILTGLISFLMVFQSRVSDRLSYTPGAFMGCFTTFATGADLMTLPSMIIGYLVAIGCDYGGQWLNKNRG